MPAIAPRLTYSAEILTATMSVGSEQSGYETHVDELFSEIDVLAGSSITTDGSTSMVAFDIDTLRDKRGAITIEQATRLIGFIASMNFYDRPDLDEGYDSVFAAGGWIGDRIRGQVYPAMQRYLNAIPIVDGNFGVDILDAMTAPYDSYTRTAMHHNDTYRTSNKFEERLSRASTAFVLSAPQTVDVFIDTSTSDDVPLSGYIQEEVTWRLPKFQAWNIRFEPYRVPQPESFAQRLSVLKWDGSESGQLYWVNMHGTHDPVSELSVLLGAAQLAKIVHDHGTVDGELRGVQVFQKPAEPRPLQ